MTSEIPEKGTCPICGRKYAITGKGVLRRHNSDDIRCFTSPQLPAEIIPAIRMLAELENKKWPSG